MIFQEWIRENTVTLDDNYSKADMEWFAELAWKAAKETYYINITCRECLKKSEIEVEK